MDESTKAETESAYTAEAFSLLGVSIVVTAMRICYRVRVVGMKGFRGDDYLVLVAIVRSFLSRSYFRAVANPRPRT